MIYDIRHVTSYAYESSVSFARCSLRLEPMSGDGQQLLSHAVDIRPRPAERTARRDFFGTHTESVLIETAHRNLRIDSRSRVSVSRQAPLRTAPSPSWERVRDVAFEATSLGPSSPVGYVFASSLVPIQAPVTAYASSSFPPGSGILAGAADLMHRIRSDFRYDPKATVISTPLKEVFENRHGVCQDFAHVMIRPPRSGPPAAHVSGYLRTIRRRANRACKRTPPTPVRCGAAPRSAGSASIHQSTSWSRTPHHPGDRPRLLRRLAGDGIIVGSRKQKLNVAVDVLLVE